jgi:hypothetical protein
MSDRDSRESFVFRAMDRLEGFCEPPDLIEAKMATDVALPPDGKWAGSWFCTNVSVGGPLTKRMRRLSYEQFAKIGGFVAEVVPR